MLRSISLSPVSVVGGNPVTGTVDADGGAPAADAVVTLSGSDPVNVPPRSPWLPVQPPRPHRRDPVVGETIASTISGSYGGANASAVLSVTPAATAATARFGVSGADVTDTCKMAPDGASLQCTFVAAPRRRRATSSAGNGLDGCNDVAVTATTRAGDAQRQLRLLPAAPLPAGTTSLPLRVTLTIRDSLGNVSAVTTNSGARVPPQGARGYPPS